MIDTVPNEGPQSILTGKLKIKSFLIVLIILSFAIQDIKIGPSGVGLSTANSPFIYEILIAFFFLYTVWHILVKHKKALAYLPAPWIVLFICLFIVNFMTELDYDMLIGNGSFRMFLWCSCFFIVAGFHEFTISEIRYFVYAMILIALVNSVYNILFFLGIVNYTVHLYEPSYWGGIETTRFSGLSYQPAYFGVVVSTGIAVTIPLLFKSGNRLRAAVTLLLLIEALLLSMSRSGILAIFGAFIAYGMLRRNAQAIILLSLSLGVLVGLSSFYYGGSAVWDVISLLTPGLESAARGSGDETRVNAAIATLYTALEHPFGIPWGTGDMPHNILMQILTWGGIPALGIFCYIVFSTMRKTALIFKYVPIYIQSVFLGALNIILFSQTEQSLNVVVVIFPLFLLLVCLSYWNNIESMRYFGPQCSKDVSIGRRSLLRTRIWMRGIAIHLE